MKKTFLGSLIFLCTIFSASAQSYKFDFTGNKKVKEGYIKISPTDRYSEEKGYEYHIIQGYDGRHRHLCAGEGRRPEIRGRLHRQRQQAAYEHA